MDRVKLHYFTHRAPSLQVDTRKTHGFFSDITVFYAQIRVIATIFSHGMRPDRIASPSLPELPRWLEVGRAPCQSSELEIAGHSGC